MNNILAIAHKELKSYFSTPIAYIVIGLFALLFGYFFYAMLVIFNQQSAQFGGLEGGAVDINQQLIRPLFLNASVILLFVLPLITMRTYSEEKRSGTIELLLTSPVTDLEIIVGKFLGAMTLYAAMLAITVIHMLLLFTYANPKPEWTVPVIGYVGLLLMGGCFISVGLLISSLTKNQIVSGMVTFAVFLLLWVINWIASFTGPTTQSVLNYLSITDHFDDFTRGILDTKHLIYYFSVMSFGLFLTARSVDTERWKG
jgi:gliding motility-associated transport system permease protein